MTGAIISLVPGSGDDSGSLTPAPDLQTLAWLNRAGDAFTVRTPERRWTARLSGLRGTQSLTFSPDGRTRAAMNVYGYVQLWDVAMGRRRATLGWRSQPRSLTFHPTRPVLAVNETGAPEGSVTLWDTKAGEKVRTSQGLKSALRPLLFAPDGTLLVPMPRYTVGWVDPQSGQVVRRLATFTEPREPGVPFRTCARDVDAASFRADGEQLLTHSSKRRGDTTGLYDVPGGGLLKTFDTRESAPSLRPMEGH
ncbi:WD40 repeat domain-containing protein [Deinococcus apachensis]|uniref:WD40 repeat domain-containing protein n=1 Tax=Deinococcus apachensis TaxID=309886 RepID=UPI0003A117B1|nr:WD40 repeat domain-containing protein [Deinococcus apachensis]